MVKKLESTDKPTGLDALADAAATTLTPPADSHADDLAVSEAQEAAAPQLTNAQCVMMAIGLVRETMASMADLQSPRVHLADDKIKAPADAIAAVLDKYHINLQAIGGNYLVEINALAVTMPVVLGAYAAIKAEIRAKDAARSAAPPPAPRPPVPAPDTAPPPPAATVVG